MSNFAHLQCHIDEQNDLISKQKAEIKKLSVELQAMRGAANSYKAELQKVTEEKDNLIKTYHECQVENIKEFVKLLKEEIQCTIDVSGHYVLYEVIKDIDNLVERFVGGNNG